MSNSAVSQVHSTAQRGWRAALSCAEEGLDLAIVDADGKTVEVLRIAENLQALMRVVKRWRKSLGVDPAETVFCVQAGRPWPSAIIDGMLLKSWEVVVVHLPVDEGASPPLSAPELAVAALSMSASISSITRALLHADKLESLRARRERLATMRRGLQSDSARNSRLHAEIQREFERMDRRHLQVLDKLLSRLDTLINLQLRDA